MKALLFASLLLATVPALAQMQAPPPAHFKGANAVVITTSDSVGVAWRTLLQTLLSKGYALAAKDEALHTFSTVPKALGGASRQLTLTGFVQPNAAGQTEVSLSGSHTYVTGLVYTAGVATMARPVVWKGGAFGADTAMFEMMEAVAAAYPRQTKPLNYIAR